MLSTTRTLHQIDTATAMKLADGSWVVSVPPDLELPDEVTALYQYREPHPCGRDHIYCRDRAHALAVEKAVRDAAAS